MATLMQSIIVHNHFLPNKDRWAVDYKQLPVAIELYQPMAAVLVSILRDMAYTVQ
jgi:hypothetical protein